MVASSTPPLHGATPSTPSLRHHQHHFCSSRTMHGPVHSVQVNCTATAKVPKEQRVTATGSTQQESQTSKLKKKGSTPRRLSVDTTTRRTKTRHRSSSVHFLRLMFCQCQSCDSSSSLEVSAVLQPTSPSSSTSPREAPHTRPAGPSAPVPGCVVLFVFFHNILSLRTQFLLFSILLISTRTSWTS